MSRVQTTPSQKDITDLVNYLKDKEGEGNQFAVTAASIILNSQRTTAAYIDGVREVNELVTKYGKMQEEKVENIAVDDVFHAVLSVQRKMVHSHWVKAQDDREKNTQKMYEK